MIRMYALNKAPIFLEFLNRFLKFSGSKIKIRNTNKLYIYNKCNCGRRDSIITIIDNYKQR